MTEHETKMIVGALMMAIEDGLHINYRMIEERDELVIRLQKQLVIELKRFGVEITK
jgi:hypothetical protein